MGLKEIAYRAAHRAPLSDFVAALSRFSDVPELARPSRAPRHPMVVSVTIDTEGGYVGEDESRIWQGAAPDAFEGYVHGIPNLLHVLERYGAKATFLVSPHGLSSKGATFAAVEGALARIVAGGHEIGLHLHPASDRAIHAKVGRTFGETSARYLSRQDKEDAVRAGRDLLAAATPADLVSFRWGNWGLDEDGARVVADAGFRIDSSAVPGLRDRKVLRRPRFDWSAHSSHEPWTIAPGLQEIPIATFRWLGTRLRADPLYGPLLSAGFDAYLERAPRCDAPFRFVLMTHSTEATRRDGSPTRVLASLDAFLAKIHVRNDVVFAPLRDALA